jgi:hypothetical protein
MGSVMNLAPLLAAGGETFRTYWERFEALDKLNGVPFFEIHRTYSANKDRMWERHTAEHVEFRRQLFLRLCAQPNAAASEFQKLLSPDQYNNDPGPSSPPRSSQGLTCRFQ